MNNKYEKDKYKIDFPESGTFNWKLVQLKTPNSIYYNGHKIIGVVLHDGNFMINGVLFLKTQFEIIDDNPFNQIYCKDISQIKVFVTKTREFRAKIKENKESVPYEVTIGGESWKNGKGRKFEETIKRKCELLIKNLNSKFDSLDFVPNYDITEKLNKQQLIPCKNNNCYVVRDWMTSNVYEFNNKTDAKAKYNDILDIKNECDIQLYVIIKSYNNVD